MPSSTSYSERNEWPSSSAELKLSFLPLPSAPMTAFLASFRCFILTFRSPPGRSTKSRGSRIHPCTFRQVSRNPFGTLWAPVFLENCTEVPVPHTSLLIDSISSPERDGSAVSAFVCLVRCADRSHAATWASVHLPTISLYPSSNQSSLCSCVVDGCFIYTPAFHESSSI